MRIDFTDTAVGGFNYELIRTLSSIPTGGTELGEAIGIALAIPDDDVDGWEREWSQAADRLGAMADAALARGARITARDQLLRASNYYRAAAFYAESGSDSHYTLWDRSRTTFQKAAPLLDPPVEIVQIPFGESVMSGYFIAAGEGPRPTIVVHGGYDSTLEEVFHIIGPAAVERSWNCLCYEGPGQWSARYGSGATFRPDWEVPVAAAVDWVLDRPEVDSAAVVLVGYSMGGHLAARAAAFEPRLAACVANSLLVNIGGPARALFSDLSDAQTNELLAKETNVATRWFVDHGQWAMGADSPAALFRLFESFDLSGLAGKIACPLLNVVGEDEVEAGLFRRAALDFLEEVPQASSHLFLHADEGLAAAHCQPATMRRAHEVTFDWLDDVLAGRQLLPAVPDSLREAVERSERIVAQT